MARLILSHPPRVAATVDQPQSTSDSASEITINAQNHTSKIIFVRHGIKNCTITLVLQVNFGYNSSYNNNNCFFTVDARKGHILMIDCLDASRYFIMRAYEDGMEATITNMKVQKLLYYSQSLHLALYDEPLFAEEIQAWRYGPVCPPAYCFYSEFEAKQLPIPDQKTLGDFAPDHQKLLEEVWEFFGHYHAFSLSDMSHGEFPWKKARKNLPPDASSTEPILHSDLKALGYQKLDCIERENPLYQPLIAETLKNELSAEASNLVGKGKVRDWLNSLLD